MKKLQRGKYGFRNTLVGMYYYGIEGEFEFDCYAEIEEDNVYDKNAIAIFTENGLQIGYIARNDKKELLEALKKEYKSWFNGKSKKYHQNLWEEYLLENNLGVFKNKDSFVYGKTFVVSRIDFDFRIEGANYYDNDKMCMYIIEYLGGKLDSSVTKSRTDYIIGNYLYPSAKENALKWGKTMLTFSDFLKKLKDEGTIKEMINIKIF